MITDQLSRCTSWSRRSRVTLVTRNKLYKVLINAHFVSWVTIWSLLSLWTLFNNIITSLWLYYHGYLQVVQLGLIHH